jgi:hypothetical protein
MPAADLRAARPADIVVTGLGAVTPYGWGVEPLWEGILGGVTRVAPFTRFDATRHRTHLAAEVPPGNDLPPSFSRLSIADRFAVASAREAVAEPRSPSAVPRSAPASSSELAGGMLEGEWFYEAHIRRGARATRRRGARRLRSSSTDPATRRAGRRRVRTGRTVSSAARLGGDGDRRRPARASTG